MTTVSLISLVHIIYILELTIMRQDQITVAVVVLLTENLYLKKLTRSWQLYLMMMILHLRKTRNLKMKIKSLLTKPKRMMKHKFSSMILI